MRIVFIKGIEVRRNYFKDDLTQTRIASHQGYYQSN